jgi:transposase
MDTVIERPGALDVHKASVTAAVRRRGRGVRREEHLAQLPTTVAGLLALRDWLEAHGVTQVAMEATGICWRPVWAVLEDRFELLLVSAQHVKQVPGHKTDVSDAGWRQPLEAGLLRASLVPPKPIRTLRNLTRHRKTQIQDRQREANRLHQVLEDAGIKLDCVATNVLGVSGRAMLAAAAIAPRLAAGLAIVQEEPQTTRWFAIRLGLSTFGIFDAFPDDSGRQAHLSEPSPKLSAR